MHAPIHPQLKSADRLRKEAAVVAIAQLLEAGDAAEDEAANVRACVRACVGACMRG